MKETFGEKLKRLFIRNRTDGSADSTKLQPDILDVIKQEEPAPAMAESAEETAESEPVVLEDISEEGPRFSSEDLAQMSEGSWRPEGEQDITEMLVEVPETEEMPVVTESPEKAELQESMAKDSAEIDELAAQMETMAFFIPDTAPETEEIELPDVRMEAGEFEDTVFDEYTAMDPAEEFSEEIIPEEHEKELFLQEEPDIEDIIEELSYGTEEVTPEEETDTVCEEGTSEEDDAIQEDPDEASEETGQEEAEQEADELPEETPDSDAEESTEEDSLFAKDLTDMWGLNKTPEEIEKEKRQERRRRRFTYAAVLLILLGIAGSGAYAYEQGWRINLFYEVQHTSESETPKDNGKKKRPDSSEFAPKQGEQESEDPSVSSETEGKRPGLSVLERLEELLNQDISGIFTDGDTEPEQNTGEPGTETVNPEKEQNGTGTADTGNEQQSTGEAEKEPDKEKEFAGITVSKEDDPEKIVEEGPVENLENPDQVTVEETGPIQTVEVERAVNYYLSADGSVREVRALPGEINTVQDLLNKANVKLGSDDIIEPSLDSALEEGGSVKITRILYKQVTETESIPGQAIEKLTPVLRSGRTYAINSDNQADGEKQVTYLEKYVDGVLESREEISSEVTKEPTDYILLTGANVPASPINGAQYTDVQILDNVPSEYSAVYSGRCTAYNFKKGSYGASGMYLSQGMVAVDPNVIPYGSLLYITNADGSFVYGWAIAADYCEASAAGDAVVDCFFDTYREAALFGVRYLNVYVVKQLTQGELTNYVAKEGMFRSRVPA